MEVTIREARPSDAAAAAALSAQLGYAVTAAEMERRLRAIDGMPDHTVLIACGPDGTVIGWADVSMTFHLQDGRYGEIGGLVVAESARSAGVGKALVGAAEQWVGFGGATRMLVRSNVVRERAHGFYLREGYRRVKTSAVFEKDLAGA